MEYLYFTIPAVIVLLATSSLTYFFFRNDQKKREHELKITSHKQTTPLRLQAYERLTLFLERISPENMLVRVKQARQTNEELQYELLRTIRMEFEHNFSQQIYVSAKAWKRVCDSKEFVVKTINTCAIECNPKGNGMELSKMILENIQDDQVHSPHATLLFLKKEVQALF